MPFDDLDSLGLLKVPGHAKDARESAQRVQRDAGSGSVAHQTSGRRELTPLIDGGYTVTNSERREPFAVAGEKCISADHQAARLQLRQFCKGRFQFAFGAGAENGELQSHRLSRRPYVTSLGFRENRRGRIDKQSYGARCGEQFMQQFEPLRRGFFRRLGYAGDVAARPIEAGD
jgi:hypothetical protein